MLLEWLKQKIPTTKAAERNDGWLATALHILNIILLLSIRLSCDTMLHWDYLVQMVQ